MRLRKEKIWKAKKKGKNKWTCSVFRFVASPLAITQITRFHPPSKGLLGKTCLVGDLTKDLTDRNNLCLKNKGTWVYMHEWDELQVVTNSLHAHKQTFINSLQTCSLADVQQVLQRQYCCHVRLNMHNMSGETLHQEEKQEGWMHFLQDNLVHRKALMEQIS